MHGRAIRSGLILAGALALTAPALAVTGTANAVAATTCESGGPPTFNNFNGDDWPDAVVGVPYEDLDGVTNAGRIEVRYTNVKPQGFHEPDPRAHDHFGIAFADVQVNNDSCTDLVVGAPGRTVDGKKGAGAIYVYLGSPTGLEYAGELDQAMAGVPGTPQAGAHFGATIAPMYTDVMPRHNVWVGAPDTDVGGNTDAGAVVKLSITPGSNGGVTASGTLLSEGFGGIPGSPGAGDHFGAAISYNGIAIGAPGKTLGGHVAAGAAYFYVDAYQASGYREITQETDGVPGGSEAGDRFGASVLIPPGPDPTGMLVGSPGESIGSIKGAGRVVAVGAIRLTGQVDSHGNHEGDGTVVGKPETGDHFGASLGSVEDRTWAGAPDEDIGGVKDTGAVFALGTSVLDDHMSWNQRTPGIPGGNERNDHFGAFLGTIADTTSIDPLVGIPGENSGAGSVLVGLPGLGSGATRWHQETGASEAGDHFGHSLSYLHAFPS